MPKIPQVPGIPTIKKSRIGSKAIAVPSYALSFLFGITPNTAMPTAASYAPKAFEFLAVVRDDVIIFGGGSDDAVVFLAPQVPDIPTIKKISYTFKGDRVLS